MNSTTRKAVQGSPQDDGLAAAWVATTRTVLLVMMAVLLRSAAGAASDVNNLPASIRIGIAPGTWQGVNRNDASSAIAAWAKLIMQQRGISLEVGTTLFESAEEMCNAMRSNRLDAISMLTDQFLALDPKYQAPEVFLTTRSQSFTEKYVLLAHQGSNITNIAGLKGRKLAFQGSARTSLGRQWLDTLLARSSLGLPKKS